MLGVPAKAIQLGQLKHLHIAAVQNMLGGFADAVIGDVIGELLAGHFFENLPEVIGIHVQHLRSHRAERQLRVAVIRLNDPQHCIHNGRLAADEMAVIHSRQAFCRLHDTFLETPQCTELCQLCES
ncbi:hypothetical protein D3C73_963360 [compost metagenome]